MNASRDQALLGLALQQGLINQQQASLVRERHQQFSEAQRPVSVSALLRALKYVSDQQLEQLERTVDQTQGKPAPAAQTASARPATAGRRSPTAAARATPGSGLPLGLTQLGKYRILQSLGQGGMGAVYLAEDTHLNRKVALKVLPRELAANREFIKRFLSEARTTGKLSHPNIVVAYDIDSSQGTWYMAMEYLEGESIGQRLRRGQPLPWREALTLLKQICKGLVYAHKNGIIHRDIKPDNLFLDKASNEAKILDMGLSKNLHANENSALTQAGMILGTPHYLAPEQAENGNNIDARADIYSLGATLFHMLTGTPPFEAPTPLAIIQKHLFEPVPDLRKSKPDIPVDVANLVWKMTAKKPSDRFADCSELLAAIDSVLEGRGFRLNDPMIASGRHSGSSARNRNTGSGQRAAVRASGVRDTRGHTAVQRKTRSHPGTPTIHPIALFALFAVGAIALVAAGIWALQSPAAPDATVPPAPTTAQQPPAPGRRPPQPAATGPTSTPPSATPTPAATPDSGASALLAPPAPSPLEFDTDAMLDVLNIAGRGLNLSNDLDRTLADIERTRQMQNLPPTTGGEGSPAAGSTLGADTGAPAAGAANPLAPVAGGRPLVHALTAADQANAARILDGFDGKVVFRMPVPAVVDETIRRANIKNVAPKELGNLTLLQMGPPPVQRDPEVYQGVFVEPETPPTGRLAPGARVRMIVKIESGDNAPIEFRLMHSSLPTARGNLLGGSFSALKRCDWTLLDLPLQLYNEQVQEHNWFGYACGAAGDFRAGRKLTFTVSDIIIYNPKPQ